MLITSESLRVKDWFSLDNQGLRSFFSVLRKLLQNLKGCVDLIGTFCCSDIFPFVLSNSSRVCNGCWCHEMWFVWGIFQWEGGQKI